MKPATKTQVFRFLVEMRNEADKYLDAVPTDIRPSVFDNEYANCTGRSLDTLIDAYFGEYSESVNWFLYEWREGYEVGCTAKDGEKITAIINDFDQYIEYLKANEGWQD